MSTFKDQQLDKVKDNIRLLKVWADRLEKRLFNNDGILDGYLIKQIEEQAGALNYNAALYNGATMQEFESSRSTENKT